MDRRLMSVLNVAAAFAVGFVLVYRLATIVALRRDDALSRPTDLQLRERVRARLTDLVSHPDAIEVEVQDGIVRVSGQVLSNERDGLLSRLTDMPGVYKVHNALTASATLG